MTSSVVPLPMMQHTANASGRLSRGFASVFATADGERVMVAALDQRQFADLAMTAGLTSTLTSWFGRHTVTELATAFTGTSVPWRLCPTSPMT